MIKLHSLKAKAGATRRPGVRVGRGNGSGHGTYSSRGSKGQGQHSTPVRPGFEGGQTPLIRRLPKLKGFTSHTKKSFQVVNLNDLNRYNDGEEVTFESLLKHGLIRKDIPVKILADGAIQRKLTVKIHKVSRSARQKIVARGGKVL